MAILEELKDLETREEARIKALESIVKQRSKEPGAIIYHGGNKQFYRYKITPSSKPKYLKKSETQQIVNLVEKKYSAVLLKAHQRNLSIISKAIQEITDDNLIKEELIKRYSVPVNPLLMTADEIKRRWQLEPYETNTIELPKDAPKTMRGECVRSKSELTIANWLYMHKVPYRYECNVYLKNARRYYSPDFVIMHPKTLRLYYLEYFGMMSVPEYAKNTFIKIANYGKEGYYVGDKLIVFFESEDVPINSNLIDGTLSKIFNVD